MFRLNYYSCAIERKRITSGPTPLLEIRPLLKAVWFIRLLSANRAHFLYSPAGNKLIASYCDPLHSIYASFSSPEIKIAFILWFFHVPVLHSATQSKSSVIIPCVFMSTSDSLPAPRIKTWLLP